MIAFDASNINWIAASSLSWDFGGALFLAKALVWNKDQAILRNSEAHFGFNLQLLRSQVEQRTDARYGIAQLFISALIVGASSLGIKTDFLPAFFLFLLPALVWHQYASYSRRDNLIACIEVARGSPSGIGYWFDNFADMSDEKIVKYYRLNAKKMLNGLADGFDRSCQMMADAVAQSSDQDIKQKLYNVLGSYRDLPEFPQLVGQLRARIIGALDRANVPAGSNACRFYERHAAAMHAIIDEYQPTAVTERVRISPGRPIVLPEG